MTATVEQVLGQFWSWKKVGSPGMFSRIACCDMDTLKVQNLYKVVEMAKGMHMHDSTCEFLRIQSRLNYLTLFSCMTSGQLLIVCSI